jgi:hypothetical protein
VDVTAVPIRNPQVVHRAVGEGEVLLHLDTGAYHGLSTIGAIIWQLVDGERTVGAIVEELRARVHGAPPELESDVVTFLDALHERDLLAV